MSHPEYPNVSSAIVSLLDDNTNHHLWKDRIVNKIHERAHMAAAHLDTGVAPAFPMPQYERRTICGRKVASNILLVRGGLTEEEAATIAIVNFAAADRGTAFDEEDRYFYYSVEVNPEFFGITGKMTFDQLLRAAIQNQNHYVTQQKPYAWTVLEQNVSERMMSQVRIPPAEYETKRSQLDYFWLSEKIKFIHTGEGAHSITLQVMKLLTARMDGDGHREYNAHFTKIITDITRRGTTPQALVPIIINTAYHYGLRGNGNHFYTHELNKLLTLPELPNYEITMGHMTTLHTALRGIDEYSNNVNNGVVQANAADANRPPRKLSNNHNSSNSTNKTTASSDVNTVYGDMCLNCARKGHMARDCTSPPSVCDTCRKSHHSSLHKVVQAVKDKRSKMKTSRRQPVKRSTSQMIQKAKLKDAPFQEAYTGEIDDIELSLEEQIDDMELLDANIAESEKQSSLENDEEYDEEFGANFSTVQDDIDIEGYTLQLVDLTTEKQLNKEEAEKVWSDADDVKLCECYNVTTADVKPDIDIIAAIDSACSATLIDQMHINDPVFKNIHPCYNVGVRGVDRKAKAIPARYVGKHPIVGTVFFGDFKNLISVSRLFDMGHKMDGYQNHINIRDKDDKIILTGLRDKSNMFMTNLSHTA